MYVPGVPPTLLPRSLALAAEDLPLFSGALHYFRNVVRKLLLNSHKKAENRLCLCSIFQVNCMKKLLQVLKWLGIVIGSLIALCIIAVFALQNKTFDAPYPDITASTDSAVIARGNGKQPPS